MYANDQLTNSLKPRTGYATFQAWPDGLNFTANALVVAGTEPSQLPEQMTDQIAAVERATKRKGNHGADYVRVSKPNAVRWLSARIAGVVMSANFFKPGVYNHDNAHVAQSLRALADLIENASVPLADNDIELYGDR